MPMIFKNYASLLANGATPLLKTKRDHILQILSAALTAVDPYTTVTNCFSQNTFTYAHYTSLLHRFKNIYLVGFHSTRGTRIADPMWSLNFENAFLTIDRLSFDSYYLGSSLNPYTFLVASPRFGFGSIAFF